ncbi:hypothetical protein ACFBZI_11590 [Moraxella sp. ZJ142]|uniref:hypothetical protein n=1 Tax=Moraxella marmotae TaxID=3344520 RepID=UPI0035D51F23
MSHTNKENELLDTVNLSGFTNSIAKIAVNVFTAPKPFNISKQDMQHVQAVYHVYHAQNEAVKNGKATTTRIPSKLFQRYIKNSKEPIKWSYDLDTIKKYWGFWVACLPVETQRRLGLAVKQIDHVYFCFDNKESKRDSFASALICIMNELFLKWCNPSMA